LGAAPAAAAKYPDPWRAFQNRYLRLVTAWLRRAQAGARAPVRNLTPEELLSAVYLKFGTVRPDRLGRPGSFRAWLRLVVDCAIADDFRKSPREAGGPGLGEVADPGSPAALADALHADQVAECFTAAVEQFCRGLDHQWQEVLVRRRAAAVRRDADIDSLAGPADGRCREIAERFSVPVNTVFHFSRRIRPALLARVEDALERLDTLREFRPPGPGGPPDE
jgi:DNA-directed RNA polymerase specialized sigma24 family protein